MAAALTEKRLWYVSSIRVSRVSPSTMLNQVTIPIENS